MNYLHIETGDNMHRFRSIENLIGEHKELY